MGQEGTGYTSANMVNGERLLDRRRLAQTFGNSLFQRAFDHRLYAQEANPARPRYLDATALETPSLALADAARETLRMGDMVETMLRKVMSLGSSIIIVVPLPSA